MMTTTATTRLRATVGTVRAVQAAFAMEAV